MNIVGVIHNNATSSECYALTTYAYDTFISEMYNKQEVLITLALQLDHDSFLFIDPRKLYVEQPMEIVSDGAITPVSNWTTLERYLNGLNENTLRKYLTRTIVPRLIKVSSNEWKTCPFYSNIETQIKIIGVENAFGINVEFGDHKDPFVRTKSIESGLSPDIVITNTGREDIDLNNTIPIINGNAFYPVVWNNLSTNKTELFALQASKLIVHSNWNQNRVRTVKHTRIPNQLKYNTLYDPYAGGDVPVEHSYCYNKDIILMDFSSIGTIDKYQLKDCLDGTVTGCGTIDYDVAKVSLSEDPNRAWGKGTIQRPITSKYTINFTLPEGANIGTPMVCIGGRLFFHGKDDTLHIQESGSKIRVTLTIEHDVFHNIILSNHQKYGKQIDGTTGVVSDPQATLDELFKDTTLGTGTPDDIYRLLNEDLSMPFIVILHANKRVVTTHIEPTMEIGPDKLLFPPDVGGILYNKKTHEVVDYTRVPYASGTLIEFQMQRPLNVLNNSDPHRLTKPHFGFEHANLPRREKYVKFNKYEELRSLDAFELVDFAYVEV